MTPVDVATVVTNALLALIGLGAAIYAGRSAKEAKVSSDAATRSAAAAEEDVRINREHLEILKKDREKQSAERARSPLAFSVSKSISSGLNRREETYQLSADSLIDSPMLLKRLECKVNDGEWIVPGGMIYAFFDRTLPAAGRAGGFAEFLVPPGNDSDISFKIEIAGRDALVFTINERDLQSGLMTPLRLAPVEPLTRDALS